MTTLVAHGPGPIEVGRIALRGLAGRRLRSGLTAVGIAIGIAAMVAVLGDLGREPGVAARRPR